MEGWKHQTAKDKISCELSLYFNRVETEEKLTVPNPTYVIVDLKERSTFTYHLDEYTEVPIWRKIESVKSIGLE